MKKKVIIGVLALGGILAYLYFKNKPKVTGRNRKGGNVGNGSGNSGNTDTEVTDTGTVDSTATDTGIEEIILDDSGTGTRTNTGAGASGITVFNTNPTGITPKSTDEQKCKQSGGRWQKTSGGGYCATPPKISPSGVANPLNIGVQPKRNTGTGSSGYGCFIKGTMVTLWNKEKIKIEDVTIGMEVLTFNEETEKQECGIVKELIRPSKSNIISVTLDNYNTIECSEEHPFFVINKGWCSYKPDLTELEVGELSVEDVLVSETEGVYFYVRSINKLDLGIQQLYNFSVEGNHNYYADGILVHNKAPKSPKNTNTTTTSSEYGANSYDALDEIVVGEY